MSALDTFVESLRSPDPLRVVGGTVVAPRDDTHVQVSIGDRIIIAYGTAVVGQPVRVLVGRGTCELIRTPLDTGWIAPSLTGGWVDFLVGVSPVGYRRRNGVVEVRGAVKSGTAGDPSKPLFTLPVEFRPPNVYNFSCVAGPGMARVDVGYDGKLILWSYSGGGNNTMVSLPTIRFSTD